MLLLLCNYALLVIFRIIFKAININLCNWEDLSIVTSERHKNIVLFGYFFLIKSTIYYPDEFTRSFKHRGHPNTSVPTDEATKQEKHDKYAPNYS